MSQAVDAFNALANQYDALVKATFALETATWPPGTNVYAKAYVAPIGPFGQKNANPGFKVNRPGLIGPLATPAQRQQIAANLAQIAAWASELNQLYESVNAENNVAAIQIAGAIVAAATAGGALEAAYGGTAGAAAAAGGAGAGAPAVGSGATAAELGTTAGAVSTPIVTGGGGAAAVGGTTAAAGGVAAVTSTGPAATTAGSALAGSTISTGSVASSVGSAVSSLTGSSTLGSIASAVVSDVSNVVSEIEAFLKPYSDFAKTVLSDVETVNRDYIQPLASTIQTDYNTINGLISEVHTLAHSGIQGILAIPSAIAQAITSVDAANQRLADLNAKANTSIASELLVPGIGGAVASPLHDIHVALSDSLGNPQVDVGELKLDRLNEVAFNSDAFKALLGSNVPSFQGKGLAFDIANALLLLMRPLLTVFGLGETLVSYSRQLGRQVNPMEPIGAGEIIRAWWRGQLTPDQAATELLRHGVDGSRAKLLHDLEIWVPSIADALKLYFRQVIDTQELKDALTKQGLTENDIQAVIQGEVEPVRPREMLDAVGINASLNEGFLQDSLGSKISGDIKQLYGVNRLSPEQAQLDWIGHYDIQPMAWWITAYFRGIASEKEVELAAQAHNIPQELWKSLIPIEAETIQLWMIPDMIASGLFTDQEASDYLHYIGIGDKDAAWILKYGKTKADALLPHDELGLAGLSTGIAAQMFEQGIINDSEYVDILEAHKLSPQASALVVKLTQQRMALGERRALAESLVKQVDTGALDLGAMQAQLYAAGFTVTEVNTYTQEAEKNAVAKAKVPSTAEIKEFAKAGILDEAGTLAALKLYGWSDQWAQAFITLWGYFNAPTSNG